VGVIRFWVSWSERKSGLVWKLQIENQPKSLKNYFSEEKKEVKYSKSNNRKFSANLTERIIMEV